MTLISMDSITHSIEVASSTQMQEVHHKVADLIEMKLILYLSTKQKMTIRRN